MSHHMGRELHGTSGERTTHRGSAVPEGVHSIECDVADDASVDAALIHIETEDIPVEEVVRMPCITNDAF